MFIILFILYLKSSTEQVLFNLNVCLINRLKGGPRIREASIGKWTKFHSNYGTEGCMKLKDCITSSQVHVCCSPATLADLQLLPFPLLSINSWQELIRLLVKCTILYQFCRYNQISLCTVKSVFQIITFKCINGLSNNLDIFIFVKKTLKITEQ